MQRWFMLAAAAIALSGSAYAQYTKDNIDPTPYGFSFRLGGATAIEKDLRNFSNGWIGFGIDFHFTKQYIRNSETYFSLDYLTRSTSGEKGTFWPILINQRFYTSTEEPGRRTYFLAGIGLVVIDVTSSDTVFGGRVGLGMELSDHIFAEASLFLSEENRDKIGATSAGFYLGYRF